MSEIVIITLIACIALLASSAHVTLIRRCVSIRLGRLDVMLYLGWYRRMYGVRSGYLTLPFASVAWK